jgi:hypothetical protein
MPGYGGALERSSGVVAYRNVPTPLGTPEASGLSQIPPVGAVSFIPWERKFLSDLNPAHCLKAKESGMRKLLMASTFLMCGISAGFAQAPAAQNPPEPQQQQTQRPDEGQREHGDRDREGDRDRGLRERDSDGRRHHGDRDRDRGDWDRREYYRDRDRDFDRPRRRQRVCIEDVDGDIHCRYR